jgi:hypothetical protein
MVNAVRELGAAERAAGAIGYTVVGKAGVATLPAWGAKSCSSIRGLQTLTQRSG